VKAKLIEFVGRVPLLGSALRRLARRYSEGSVVEIRSGVAAGYRWRRHRRYVNGYWLGHYELDIQDLLKHELKAGQTFFDIGANAGFFTLVAAKLVGPSGKCVAFDPAPDNDRSIREQLELNSLNNCIAVPKAVGGQAGTAMFAFSAPGSATGHLGAASNGEHAIEVQVITLDQAASQYGRPDFIKLDVEGAEMDVLRGAANVLSNIRPRWLIEIHNTECERGVVAILKDAGYAVISLMGKEEGADLPRHILARPREVIASQSRAPS
jgi:FkbM family methyltransferase